MPYNSNCANKFLMIMSTDNKPGSGYGRQDNYYSYYISSTFVAVEEEALFSMIPWR